MTDARTSRWRRHWLQFRLRTVFVGVAVAGVGFLGWRTYVEPFRLQRRAMEAVGAEGGACRTEPGAPQWMCALFGTDRFLDVTYVDLGDRDPSGDLFPRLSVMRRLETLIVGGPTITDAELKRFGPLRSLRFLVLDSTEVTDDGV